MTTQLLTWSDHFFDILSWFYYYFIFVFALKPKSTNIKTKILCGFLVIDIILSQTLDRISNLHIKTQRNYIFLMTTDIWQFLSGSQIITLKLWVQIPLGQHYVIKFVSDLWQVCSFFRVLRFQRHQHSVSKCVVL